MLDMVLLSYRFWRLFTRRDWDLMHPVRRGYLFRGKPQQRKFMNRAVMYLFGILVFFASVYLFVKNPLLILLRYLPNIFVAPLLFMGTITGFRYAISIACSIADQHEKQRYDLISATFLGGEGLNWLACIRAYERHDILSVLGQIIRGFCVLIGGTVAFLGLLFALNTALPYVTFTIILYLDIVQSSLLGCVVGMVVPTYIQDRLTSQFMAGVVFFSVQFITYAILFGLIYTRFEDDAVLAYVMCPVGFYLLRELEINGLLYLLARRLDSSFASLKQAFEVYA